MASAGMGVVLTGIIAALLAQGASSELALLAGVFVHGAAGDAAVDAGRGPAGLTATELIETARSLLNQPAMGGSAASPTTPDSTVMRT
jgi:NAD(P)H-hydrate repair Nnr-like enzyme with NAD(P)H-hydrate dehydratase domain